MPFQKGTIRKEVGFSKEEWETVCRKAEKLKMRTGTYIRRIAVCGEVRYYDLHELMALKRSFTAIGNNLNQIAAVANTSGSIYKKDIEEMQEVFRYFKDAMKSYLFEISPTFIS